MRNNFSNALVLFLLLNASIAVISCAKKGGGGEDGNTANSNQNQNTNKPSTGKPNSVCDRKATTTFNICVEGIGSDYADPGYLDIVKTSCESTGGVFSTDPCNKTDSVGSCVIAAGQPNEVHTTFYPPQYDAASAKTACEGNSGVFQ